MKRFVLAIASLLCLTAANAQLVGGYKATTKQDIALTGATVINSNIAPADLQGTVILSDATASGWDTAEGKGFPVGFEFPFNGKKFSYFGVSAQGLIKLSETESMNMEHSNYFCTQSNDDFNNLVFCFDRNATSYEKDNEVGIEPTTISYKTTDDALIVEWKNLGMNTSSWGSNLVGAYTMQIHLMKDGTIKYRFAGLSDNTASNAGNVTMGIRGGQDEYVNFLDMLTLQSKYGSTESFNLPAVFDGYTVTLNVPGPTVTPTAQPTNLSIEKVFNWSGTGVSVEFDKAEGVDNYLMLISKGEPTVLPKDGTFYAVDDELGNATVMLAGQPGSWGTSYSGLDRATEYTVTVYAYNSFGTEGPKYNTVNPLQGKVSTGAEAPGELTVVATSSNSIKIKAAANAAGNKVLVAYNTVTNNPGNYGNRGYVGTPNANMKAGDVLYDGELEAGKVAYFGEAGEFVVEDLNPSQSYYFVAFSYDEAKGVFSEGFDFTQAWTSTNITVPFTLDLKDAPDSESLGGWQAEPNGYNEGFVVEEDPYSVYSQTEDNRVYSCCNYDNDVTYKLTSPTIELTSNNTITLDWHIHIMAGGGWFKKPSLYDEWADDDQLTFVVYVDGERVVLKKYDSDNAPVNNDVYDEDDTYDQTKDWHTETFDLAAYAGKNVKFGIEWLGANSSRLYMGMENFSVSGVTTPVNQIATFTANNGNTYNLSGQKVRENTRGIVIQNNKKVVNK